MKIKDFKSFLSQIPDEMAEYHLVFRAYTPSEDGELLMALDNPIATIFVDEETHELCFLDKESIEIYDNWEVEDEDI